MHFALNALILLWLKVWHVSCEDTMTENHRDTVDERQFIALGAIRVLLTQILNVTDRQSGHGTDFRHVLDAVNRTHNDFQEGISTLASFLESRQHDSKGLVTSMTGAMDSTRTALKEMSVIGAEAVSELSAMRYAMTNLTEVLAKTMLKPPKVRNLVERSENSLLFVPCEAPYFKVLGNRGTECYKVYAEKMKWEAARKTCLSEGSDLAQPTDLEALWQYLKENEITGDYWMGGTDAVREGEWRWLSGEPITGPWHHQQPQGDGDCLDLLATNDSPVLNDYICHNAQSFICQRYTAA